jgi:hypothetical protein
MNIEQTKEAIRIMQAFVDGKEVEWRHLKFEGWETIISPKWNWYDNEYRIKPTAKLRPWTADEVPLGAWMRYKNNTKKRWLIINATDLHLHQLWLENSEHSTDKGVTWHPCGVMEESK